MGLFDSPYYVIQNQEHREPSQFMSGRRALRVVLAAARRSKDSSAHFRVGTEAQTSEET